MPREIIRRLARDVERVLVAGAQLAATDADLAAARTAVESLASQLGTKAPAIAQLAAAAARTCRATGADASRELVGLATMCAQVRSAQSAPCPAPPLRDLAPRPLIGTPCSAKDLAEITSALLERGKARHEIILAAVDSGTIADLRLVDALIFAMNDSYLGELITTKAIPKLGPAAIAPLRALLTVTRGRPVDGRRLRGLVAVQGSEARDLLIQALTEGTADLREAALTALADHLRGDPQFEQLALDAVSKKERTKAVRIAGLRALAAYASDASLQALLAHLDDDATLPAAAEALGTSRHPKAVDALLVQLDAMVEAAKQMPTGTINYRDRVHLLLKALTSMRDPRIADRALGLVESYDQLAADAVVANGDHRQRALIADLIWGPNVALYAVAAAALMSLTADERYERVARVFLDTKREQDIGLRRLGAVARYLERVPDPRWAELCLAQLTAPMAVAMHAIPLLGHVRDARALPHLIRILTTQTDSEQIEHAIQAVGRIGDDSAMDALLVPLRAKKWRVRALAIRALVTLANPAAVDKVRALVAAFPEDAELGLLFKELQRHFPGK